MGQGLLLRRDLPFHSTFRALDKHRQEQLSLPEQTVEKGVLNKSGIAVMYAAGALTAKEVIATSWKREMASQKPKKAGGMAVIGLSAEEASPLLSAGIVVTCEDSPKSAIISGDAKEIQKPVEHTRESHSDIGARVLKVDKAYHSHHMSETGSEYHAMIQPQLEDKSPLKLSFFNVTGDKIKEHLHDSY
ncbi:hypothetical protein CI102_13876 [Trichoderma harzianum]|nr:hypothetical protein CI102_13876 [Trichoderma harzianum]